MHPLFSFLLAAGLWAWLFGLFPGADEGRVGNRHYGEQAFEQADASYTAGLLALETDPPEPALRADLTARLDYNRGLALYQQEAYEEARSAFAAATAAPDPDLAAAAHYSAGLTAARQQEYAAAQESFAQALRLRPDFPDAAYNWEWVARQTADEPPPEDEQAPPPDPSTFAEDLKAQADELVAARRYREAYDLMADGLERDSTVGAYADFTERLGAVAEIEDL
jgi:tetratricopeptide (TPR) repeat protein